MLTKTSISYWKSPPWLAVSAINPAVTASLGDDSPPPAHCQAVIQRRPLPGDWPGMTVAVAGLHVRSRDMR
jgi:hypothetical protein